MPVYRVYATYEIRAESADKAFEVWDPLVSELVVLEVNDDPVED